MATNAQRASRRRQRNNRATRRAGPIAHVLGPKRAQRKTRSQRGILANLLGGQFGPIGATLGQAGDTFIGGQLGNLFGSKGSTAPVAQAGRFFSNQVNRSTEKGTEQITQITVPAGTPAGTVLLQQLIAGPEIGVRLKSFANLWTKTKFRNFVVQVTSSNPTSVPGNYTLAIDPDPVQHYPSGEALPARLMALTNAVRANAWADCSITMKPNPLELFNEFDAASASEAETRQYAAGQLILATTTAYSEKCEYTVTVYWDVEFSLPDTDAESVGPTPSQKRHSNFAIKTNCTGCVPNATSFSYSSTSPMPWDGDGKPVLGDYTGQLQGNIADRQITITNAAGTGNWYLGKITKLVAGSTSTDIFGTWLSGAPPIADLILGKVTDISPSVLCSVDWLAPATGLVNNGFAKVSPWYTTRRTYDQNHLWYINAHNEEIKRKDEEIVAEAYRNARLSVLTRGYTDQIERNGLIVE